MMSENQDWVKIPEPQKFKMDSLMENLSDGLLTSLLTLVQDGICFLDKDLNIIYINPTILCWYPDYVPTKGRKCYAVYHHRSEPCDNCPVLKAIKDKNPTTGVVPFENNKSSFGWQQIYCTPILDNDNEVILAIEYIRDISKFKHLELSSELIESQNKLLLGFLEEKRKEKELMERNFAANIDRIIQPVLRYLENVLDAEAMNIVKRQLDLSTQTITEKKEYLFDRLSPKEMQVAKLIGENKLSKEIADQLQITKKAVDFHRTNIRKKLSLSSEVNLQRYIEMNM